MEVSFEATAALQLALNAIRLAWIQLRAPRTAAAASEDQVRQAYELAARLSGSVLFELRSNIERVRHTVSESEKDCFPFAPFDLSISDSVLPRLCEVMPAPNILGEFHFAFSAVRRVDFFQRLAGSAPLVTMSHPLMQGRGRTVEDERYSEKAVAFARDALDKGIIDRFNRLRAITTGIGQAALGEAWEAAEPAFLPGPIDPSASIDHSLI